MRKRIFIFLGLVALILGAGYLTLWLTTPKRNLAREAFDHIQVGMTLVEVEKIIGLPHGSYHYEFRLGRLTRIVRAEWCGDFGLIRVRLNGEGTVSNKSYLPLNPDKPSLLDRLRKLLGLEA